MRLLRLAGMQVSPGGKRQSTGLFLCPHCDKTVERVLSDGKRNKSCGCARTSCRALNKDVDRNLFWVFHGIKARCHNPKNIAYHRYGGRGITICDEWLNDPRAFFAWAIGNGWRKGLEIDRKDNDGDYNPENCQVVTHLRNSRKRPGTKMNYVIAEKLRKRYAESGKTQKEIAVEFGVSLITAQRILTNKTWTTEDIKA